MNTHDIELPPLPKRPEFVGPYTAKDMQAYATAAIEADRKRIAELEAARIAYASEFPPNEDGDPDVGSIHENIRKLKADRKRRGEPVGYFYPWELERSLKVYPKGFPGAVAVYAAPQPLEPSRGEPYAQLIVVDEDDEWPQLVYLKGVNLEPGVHDLFLSPQPAEPVKRKRRYAQGTALGEFGIIPMCDQVDDEPVMVPSDAEIDAVFNDMPDGPNGWLKSWGYRQFARALLARYGGGHINISKDDV